MPTSACATTSKNFSSSPGVWPRAAALGSLWASFEIVLGSFLHNLRVPFTGMLLAAVGVVLMTAAAQLWRDRGLVWRAAAVCALMKSLSPSAVILNPMIGIFTEGLLLQLALWLLGTSLPGCALGGMAAVSFTLVQKIVSLLITYGTDIVRLYDGIVRHASKTLGLGTLEPLDLVLVLLFAQAAAGMAAGSAGWWLGKRVELAGRPVIAAAPGAARELPLRGAAVRPSIVMLALLLASLPTGLWLVSTQPLRISAPVLLVAILLAISRYHRGLGKLRRARLWVELGVVLVASGLVLGAAQGDWRAGLAAGGQMLLRAVFVVVFFSSVSVELKHPRILGRLENGRLRNLSLALQAASNALPDFLGSLPSLQAALRQPTRTLAAMLARVDRWQQRLAAAPAIVVLTGDKGVGKSTLCAEAAQLARQRGCKVAGVVSIGHWDDGIRSGYEVRDLMTGETRWLARRDRVEGGVRYGQFWFDPGGFELGQRALELASCESADLLIVDEVGPLELAGHGWASELDRLHERPPCPMIWVVRPSLIGRAQARWPRLQESTVVQAASTTPTRLLELAIAQAGSANPPREA